MTGLVIYLMSFWRIMLGKEMFLVYFQQTQTEGQYLWPSFGNRPETSLIMGNDAPDLLKTSLHIANITVIMCIIFYSVPFYMLYKNGSYQSSFGDRCLAVSCHHSQLRSLCTT